MHGDLILVGLTVALGVGATIVFFMSLIYHHRFHSYLGISILFLLEAIYAIAYAFELAAVSLELKIIFNHIQYLGIPFISVTWLFVAKRFTDRKYVWKLKKEFWFLIVPIIIMFSVQFFSWFGFTWYYTGARLIEFSGLFDHTFYILVLDKGFLYYIAQVYSLVIIAYVSWLYFSTARNSTGIQRKQSITMAIAGLVASLSVIPALLSETTAGIDFSLFLLCAIGYVILYTMFHYELVDLLPSANRSMFLDSTDPIFIFDDKFDLVSWNHSTDHFELGLLIYQKPISEVFNNSELIKSVYDLKPYSFNFKNKHYVTETVLLHNKQQNVLGYVVRFLEMTSYVDRINRLDYEASHDSLTDILNQRAFFDLVSSYRTNPGNLNRSCTFIMFDLDDFKAINDQYGHLTGDYVLKSICDLISGMLPPGAWFCRFGGEEFLIFEPDITEEDSLIHAENYRQAVDKLRMEFHDKILKIQISAGVTHGTLKPDSDINDCITKADEALYAAKRAGKNRVLKF